MDQFFLQPSFPWATPGGFVIFVKAITANSQPPGTLKIHNSPSLGKGETHKSNTKNYNFKDNFEQCFFLPLFVWLSGNNNLSMH
jgi:hypothetical protein